ncbi:LysR family transcriptional regulator [Bacillus sp. 165]|uniref:LysR family transcriptional regulator n=1 Tax=Bacillus sp. 165 TaxID=1529117 RepID=UPI001ADD01ED|nr:LysR family transcriptional regulator [Bacillus sp. 165]MBO9131046.1 LysR family transcriptional regulator [Bacillus sp. 165]
MNIERLNYIFEVSKAKSISIAAYNLHVTQSTISQAITSVEKELGVTLFTRSKQGTVLTFEGKQLIVVIKELVEKAQDLKEKAQYYQDELSGVLRIAAIPGLMAIILRVYSTFKKDYPNVQLIIAEKDSKEILEDVLNQKLDIGLINFYNNFPYYTNDISSEFLFNSEVHLCVSKNSHLALKESILPEDLQNETIVLYNDEFILSFAKNLMEKVPLNLLFVTDNVDAIRAAVTEGIAITFATDSSLKDEVTILNGQTVPIPIVNTTYSSVPFGLIRSKNKQVALMNDKFISYLKKALVLFEKSYIRKDKRRMS